MIKKILFSVLLFLFCFSVNVLADEGDYSIKSATFDVHLLSNGNAQIRETWYVNYEEGVFDSFFNKILLDTSKGKEKYFNVIDFKASIDGIECFKAENNEDKIPFSYYLENGFNDNESVVYYTLYFEKENVLGYFEVEYTLTNVVKLVDDSYYFFDYRILPDEFDKNIDTVYINIDTFDEESDVWIIDNKIGVATDGQNLGKVTANNVIGKYGIQIKIENTHFNVLGVSKISSEYLYLKNTGLDKTIILGCIAILIVILSFVFFVLIRNRKSLKEKYILKKYREKIIKNQMGSYSKICDIINRWVPNYFTPTLFAITMSENFFLGLFILLISLKNKRLISFFEDNSGIYIVYCNDESKYTSYSEKFIFEIFKEIDKEILDKGFNSEVADGYNIFNIRSLMYYFKDFNKSLWLLKHFNFLVSVKLPKEIKKSRLLKDYLFIKAYFEIVPEKDLCYSNLFKSFNNLEETLFYLRFTHKSIESMEKEAVNYIGNKLRKALDSEIVSIASYCMKSFVLECIERDLRMNIDYTMRVID